MSPLTTATIEEVSRLSGLKPRTVKDLFEKGWTYSYVIHSSRKWIGPEELIVVMPTYEESKPS